MNNMYFYKSWLGLDIVIFGDNIQLITDIKNSINASFSNKEINIEGFTDYTKALQYCDLKKTVPLFLIFDSCYDLPLSDILANFGSYYTEYTGLPYAGVLIASQNKTSDGYKALSENRCFLDYILKDELSDNIKTFYTLDKIWFNFTYLVEGRIIPDPLKLTFLSLIDDESTNKSILFLNRITYLLVPKFTLTWKDYMILRWIHLVNYVNKLYPNALKFHKGLLNLCQTYLVEIDHKSFNIENICSNINIKDIEKIILISRHLNELRQNNKLKSYLDKLENNLKPNSHPVLKFLIAQTPTIIGICKEIEEKDEHTGLNLLKVG